MFLVSTLFQTLVREKKEKKVLTAKEEFELTSAIFDSTRFIRDYLSDYQGDNLELLELKTLNDELLAQSKDTAYAMEKYMVAARKVKNSDSKSVQNYFWNIGGVVDKVFVCVELLIEYNLGLVGKGLRKSNQDDHYAIEDRQQDGRAGLLKAAFRYNPYLGNRFSTYACWWIKQFTRTGWMSMSRTIRWPSNVFETLSKDDGSEDYIEKSFSGSGSFAVTMTQQAPLSLDVPVGATLDSAGAESLSGLIEAPNAISVEKQVESRETVSLISKTLSKVLTEREQTVIISRFGLGSAKDEILETIGLRLGLSQEGVRRIEKKALQKLKDSNMLNGLVNLAACPA